MFSSQCFDFSKSLLTSVVVTLSVGQAIHLCSGVSGPRYSEEQRVRFHHVRVAGFKLAAGNQQGGEAARLGLDSGACIWVQRNLLLPCRDLLHRTAHILDRMKDISAVFQCRKNGRWPSFKRRKVTKNVHTSSEEIPHTHLPLLVTHFDQQHLQSYRVLLILTVLRWLP